MSWAFLPSQPSSSFPLSHPCSPASPFLLLRCFCLFAELMSPAEQTRTISYNFKLNWVPRTGQCPAVSCLPGMSLAVLPIFLCAAILATVNSSMAKQRLLHLTGGCVGKESEGEGAAPSPAVLGTRAVRSRGSPQTQTRGCHLPETVSKWVQPPPLGLGKTGGFSLTDPAMGGRQHAWAWFVIFMVAVFPKPGLRKATGPVCRCRREILWLRPDTVYSRWDLAACPAYPHLPRSTPWGCPLSGGSIGGAIS